MTSSGPDSSLPSISLPQWMKSKINDRYDLEQTAFSPPSNEDGFFLIRYKKSIPSDSETAERGIGSSSKFAAALESKYGASLTKMVSTKDIAVHDKVKVPTQHTLPCQQFIPSAITPREIGMRHGIDPPLGRVSSTGVDDGFTKEGAACGYSVVAVAHQMLAERGGDKVAPAPNSRLRTRRNSKSLPASPHSSPKLLRKNPYFTDMLFGSSDRVDSTNNNSITSSEISEKWETKFGKMMNEPETPTTPPLIQPMRALKAKPSELREMNFWSPTSM